MRPPRSLGGRLLQALLAMTLLTLAISTALSAVLDLRLLRENALRDLQVLAAVVGENCISALVFDSPKTAERHLATLAAERQVRRAVLMDAAGRRFAAWEGSAVAPAVGPSVSVSHALRFDDAPLGHIELHARLDELHRQALRYLALSAGLALATLAMALVVALRLRRRIAAPILELADKARQVSARQDLSLRMARRERITEVDTLIGAFNGMLAGIAAREGRIEAQSAALREANDKLRRLAMDLSLMEQTEKSRLATLLHDSPMQKLALAVIQLETGLMEPDAEGRQLIETGLTLLREASAELRSLQFELSPPVLEQAGLPAALAWLAERMGKRGGIPIIYRMPAGDASAWPHLSRALSVTLFQCARELVYNLIKHAGASCGRIELRIDTHRVRLTVVDDGGGFPAQDRVDTPGAEGVGSRGFGLYSNRERVRLLRGELHIDSGPDGTRIDILLPLDDQDMTHT